VLGNTGASQKLRALIREATIAAMSEDWITTVEAAQLSGYHRDHILRLIAAGKVKARKFAVVWQVDRHSLLAYIKDAEKLGKKRGPKTEG